MKEWEYDGLKFWNNGEWENDSLGIGMMGEWVWRFGIMREREYDSLEVCISDIHVHVYLRNVHVHMYVYVRMCM